MQWIRVPRLQCHVIRATEEVLREGETCSIEEFERRMYDRLTFKQSYVIVSEEIRLADQHKDPNLYSYLELRDGLVRAFVRPVVRPQPMLRGTRRQPDDLEVAPSDINEIY
jgi:hypothetical protein